MNDLTVGKNPNKTEEIERIRRVCNKGTMNKLKTVKVDLFVQSTDGTAHLFDLKTAKPNISNFKDFKRTLLEWVAIYLAKNPNAKVNSYIAIPYNPYEPKPYERWTLKGMLDLDNELKVAEEFWDFLGNDGTYSELLNCFERVGVELRPEIYKYFKNSNKTHNNWLHLTAGVTCKLGALCFYSCTVLLSNFLPGFQFYSRFLQYIYA